LFFDSFCVIIETFVGNPRHERETVFVTFRRVSLGQKNEHESAGELFDENVQGEKHNVNVRDVQIDSLSIELDAAARLTETCQKETLVVVAG